MVFKMGEWKSMKIGALISCRRGMLPTVLIIELINSTLLRQKKILCLDFELVFVFLGEIYILIVNCDFVSRKK